MVKRNQPAFCQDLMPLFYVINRIKRLGVVIIGCNDSLRQESSECVNFKGSRLLFE